jgi:TolB protein
VIWVVNVDDRTGHAVVGTRGGYRPVFTPDGRGLAFSRVRIRRVGRDRYPAEVSAAVWMVDLEIGTQRRLTKWRDELEQQPASFSPDGSTLLLTRYDTARSGGSEIVALRLDDRSSSLLVGRGLFPVYSPDGSTIAYSDQLRRGDQGSDLFLIDADGTDRRRLTRTRRAVELMPSWDPSGSRIAYFRGSLSAAIWQVNADGTCPTEITEPSDALALAAAWQPGPGREAGPISC